MSEQSTQITCGKCGSVISGEATNTPEEKRKPCPNCGSTSRKFAITLTDTVGVKEAVSQIAEASPGDVQTIAASQLVILTSYYETARNQANRSFTWALRAAAIGLVFFVGAVAFLLITQLESVAVLSVISGALVEVIAGINFFLYGRTTTHHL